MREPGAGGWSAGWTAPGAWAKVADRDVQGHIELLRGEVAGVWRVSHVKGHAERRKQR